MITLVEEKIKNANIIFDKYYWKRLDKLEICKNEKVDIMIDDNPNTCEKLAKNNIRTLYFRNIYGREIRKNEYLTEVYDWGNVYRSLGMLKDLKQIKKWQDKYRNKRILGDEEDGCRTIFIKFF